MKFIPIERGYINPRTVEVVDLVSKQYGWPEFIQVDGRWVNTGHQLYYYHHTVMATLTSGKSFLLESWDGKDKPDVVPQERLDHWLTTIEEALG